MERKGQFTILDDSFALVGCATCDQKIQPFSLKALLSVPLFAYRVPSLYSGVTCEYSVLAGIYEVSNLCAIRLVSI